MKFDRQRVGESLLVVCGGVAFYCLLQHLSTVAAGLHGLLDVLSPFLLGGAIAFVLNVPMKAMENMLMGRPKRSPGLLRPAALILTLLAVVGVFALATCVIVPGIREAVGSIGGQLPAAVERIQEQVAVWETYLPRLQRVLADAELDWKGLSAKLMQLLQIWGSDLVSGGGGLLGELVSGVSAFVIGFVFAVYLLLQKETLGRQGRQVLYALLPELTAKRTLEILNLARHTFSSFLSGQCLEAVILGTLFASSMTILRLPYALLIGVLIALTALIPIVGAFIGCGVGALLIAVTDPWKALMFVVLFLVLQQIEGNLIYPHVVGSSVGLPSIWVLAAVTLGGRLMGVVGMLVFIPLCSVVYALFREYVKRRLREKKLCVE